MHDLLRYEEPVYRPPSEASSLIFQVTVGCSHNACSFCGMYKSKKFRIRDNKEIEDDMERVSLYARGVERVFLADGNALAMDTEKLAGIVNRFYAKMQGLKRVTCYSGPKDLLGKTDEELKRIRESGLSMLYIGVESGSDEVLKSVNKGVTADQMAEACSRACAAGFQLSVTVISGLAGKEKSREHAIMTANLLNRIQPDYLGVLVLMPLPGTGIYARIEKGAFIMPGPVEHMQEIKWLLEGLNFSKACVFRCNHASNYLPLKGDLPKDRERLVAILNEALKYPERHRIIPDYMRGL